MCDGLHFFLVIALSLSLSLSDSFTFSLLSLSLSNGPVFRRSPPPLFLFFLSLFCCASLSASLFLSLSSLTFCAAFDALQFFHLRRHAKGRNVPGDGQRKSQLIWRFSSPLPLPLARASYTSTPLSLAAPRPCARLAPPPCGSSLQPPLCAPPPCAPPPCAPPPCAPPHRHSRLPTSSPRTRSTM